MSETANPTDAKLADPAAAMALFQSLSGGDESASPEALLQMLTSQIDDPQASMMATLLMSGLGDDEEVDDEIDTDFAEVDRLLVFADDDQGPSSEVEQVDDSELESLREVNDTLALALGACPDCWGGDNHCSECNGDGSPGYSMPEASLFNELILPAVRRINQSRQAGKQPAPQTETPASKENEDGRA